MKWAAFRVRFDYVTWTIFMVRMDLELGDGVTGTVTVDVPVDGRRVGLAVGLLLGLSVGLAVGAT
jgi:hypothetical protein